MSVKFKIVSSTGVSIRFAPVYLDIVTGTTCSFLGEYPNQVFEVRGLDRFEVSELLRRELGYTIEVSTT